MVTYAHRHRQTQTHRHTDRWVERETGRLGNRCTNLRFWVLVQEKRLVGDKANQGKGYDTNLLPRICRACSVLSFSSLLFKQSSVLRHLRAHKTASLTHAVAHKTAPTTQNSTHYQGCATARNQCVSMHRERERERD